MLTMKKLKKKTKKNKHNLSLYIYSLATLKWQTNTSFHEKRERLLQSLLFLHYFNKDLCIVTGLTMHTSPC